MVCSMIIDWETRDFWLFLTWIPISSDDNDVIVFLSKNGRGGGHLLDTTRYIVLSSVYSECSMKSVYTFSSHEQYLMLNFTDFVSWKHQGN